ncbi:MAG: hypothetical protein Ct9H300mP11_13410 [Chloroflexota bacterium]|nr:MAG: hypothetical protein Ct9H300mP11_13410 [Chloroflexota bacterium]
MATIRSTSGNRGRTTCVINALSKNHTWYGGANYGRPGRISNTVNVPAGDLKTLKPRLPSLIN